MNSRLQKPPLKRQQTLARLLTPLWLIGLLLYSGALTAADSAACVPYITAASYLQPTQRYRHGVLGDDIEYGALEVITGNDSCDQGRRSAIATLPEAMVFEDISPRLADIDGDRKPEVITVEASATEGARLTIWGLGPEGLIRYASTPYIGRPFRWLAPLGSADLDGDGAIEIAYIDRPHLAKTLRIWRYQNGELKQIAQREGLTNHRIGEDYISGGIRDCGRGPELITASHSWSSVVSTQLIRGQLVSETIGRFNGRQSFAAALACLGLP